jgi:hypothetical protein
MSAIPARSVSRRLALLASLALAALGACGDDETPPTDAGRTDAGPPDAGPPADLGPRDLGLRDLGPSDLGARRDLGPRGDAAVPEGCDPVSGIECDGDWLGRCTPECAATECCSPQDGVFTCAPRDDAGACPAPDLFVDESKVTDNYAVEWQYFPEGDCAIVEGCVVASGWRRLLRFDTWTPNTGTADMYLGPPSDTIDYFEYSACHAHYHFNTYAEYELRGTAGELAATGHKQAFCLLDFYRYPGTDSSGAVYDCGNQGIARGWQDVYGRDLDCQWVDVTDVPAGDYALRIAINTAHILLESNYENNVVEIPVTIPPDSSSDPTTPCARDGQGVDRDCGFTDGGDFTCTPGATVRLGCATACGVGSCEGDTVLRVCEGSEHCGSRGALGNNDDSGCREGDVCSQVRFTCPASGAYNVLWGAYRTGESATCTLGVAP